MARQSIRRQKVRNRKPGIEPSIDWLTALLIFLSFVPLVLIMLDIGPKIELPNYLFDPIWGDIQSGQLYYDSGNTSVPGQR